MANALSTRPTDAELVQLLRLTHTPLTDLSLSCKGCGVAWPCPGAQAADALEAAIVEAASAEAKYWARAQVAHDTTWIRNDDERADAAERAYNAAMERGGSQGDWDAAAEAAYDECALRQRQAAEQEYQDNHR